MAGITRNRNGSYSVRWIIGRDVNGEVRRDSKTFSNENEAIAHKVEVERYATGTGKDSLAARGNQWIDDRLALGKISDKTAVGYRQKIDAWGRLLGTKPYKKISTAEIERAFAALARGAGPSGRPRGSRVRRSPPLGPPNACGRTAYPTTSTAKSAIMQWLPRPRSAMAPGRRPEPPPTSR